MKLHDLVAASRAVAAVSGRLEKIARLAELLERLSPDEIPIAIGFLTGWPRQGKIGIGWATVEAARPPIAATEPSLKLTEVDQVLEQLQGVRGKGSAAAKLQLMKELLARCTEEEQRFL